MPTGPPRNLGKQAIIFVLIVLALGLLLGIAMYVTNMLERYFDAT